jgi:hypothetical protein
MAYLFAILHIPDKAVASRHGFPRYKLVIEGPSMFGAGVRFPPYPFAPSSQSLTGPAFRLVVK